MTLEELSKKDVIQTVTGDNLGRIDDLELEPAGAVVQAVILHGRPRLFGLLGRGPDLRIPWERIEKIGSDVVLTNMELGPDFVPRRRHALL